MKDKIKRYDLWAADGSYARRRIPGVTVTPRGTLLLYHEARRTPGDWSMMDIVLQRSADCGRTLSAPVLLARGTDAHPTVNNPVMVPDRKGRIHFLYCEDYGVAGGRILHRVSGDDGVTWSEPRDITASTRPEYRNAFAFGPGHGILTPDGTMLSPVWMVPKEYGSPLRAHNPAVVGTIFSTDDGGHWQLGELTGSCFDFQSPNEASLAVLSDGRILLNGRCHNFWRVTGVSPDGRSGWNGLRPDKRLIDPRCCGGVAAYAGPDGPYTILFGNCESQTDRKNVVVKGSTDDGRTWPLRLVIDAERGGYVDINTDREPSSPGYGNIYVLYEEDGGIASHLAVFRYDALTAGGTEN